MRRLCTHDDRSHAVSTAIIMQASTQSHETPPLAKHVLRIQMAVRVIPQKRHQNRV